MICFLCLTKYQLQYHNNNRSKLQMSPNAMIIEILQSKARNQGRYQFHLQEVFKLCRAQFHQLNFNYPYNQKDMIQLLTSLKQFDIDVERKTLTVRKPYPTITNHKTLLSYLVEIAPEGLFINQNLKASYKDCDKDIIKLVEQKMIRVANINSNFFIYSKKIDDEFKLSTNLQKVIGKKEYLKICKEKAANKVVRKEEVEKVRKQKETPRYNEWVDGFYELKRAYEERKGEKKVSKSRKKMMSR